MDGNKQDTIDGTYISFREACELLETGTDEVRQLVDKGILHAFKIGGQHLRLRKDQVSEVKARWRINRELFPGQGKIERHVWMLEKISLFERIRDYLYLNDFYIASTFVVAALIYLIISSK